MKTKIAKFFLLLVCSSKILVAQVNFGVANSSQKSASPSGVTDFSCNEYTGVGTVNIPIYQSNIDGINASVNLNYQTKGIKVNQLASSVGLGWELNTSANITRVVKGIPDELYSADNSGILAEGYWQRSNSVAGTNIDINYCNHNISDEYVIESINSNVVDGQMDIFNLNFNGRTIQFMFSCENEIITIPSDTRIKIERVINGAIITNITKRTVVNSLEFRVIDEAGNEFYFEEGDRTKLDNKYASNVSSSNIINGFSPINWVIKYIRTYNNNMIHYDYFESNLTKIATDISESFDWMNASSNIYQDCGFNAPLQNHTVNYFEGYYKFIKSISYPDITVVFNYHDEQSTTACRCDAKYSYALKEIELRERKTLWSLSIPINTRKYLFDMKYFNNAGINQPNYSSIVCNPSTLSSSTNASTNPAEYAPDFDTYGSALKLRLMLAAIQIQSGATIRNFYSFQYYPIPITTCTYGGVSTDPFVDKTARLSPHQDYWGYFSYHFYCGIGEGSNSYYSPNKMYTPDYDYPLGTWGVNRQPVPLYAYPPVSAGEPNNGFIESYSLKKVVSEEGGATLEIGYDNNYIVTTNGNHKLLDGLRILYTISNTGINNATIGINNASEILTDYIYENPEWTEPISGNFDIGSSLFSRDIAMRCPQSNGPNWVTYNGVEISNKYLGNSYESVHGYGKVTKQISSRPNNIQSASYNKILSKIVTYYTTPSTISSHLNIISTTTSGGNYVACSNNLILNPPPNGSTLFTVNSDNYFDTYNTGARTFKQYYLDWAVGLPYHIEEYDGSNQLKSEITHDYNIYIKAHNTDNFINLNTLNDLYPIKNQNTGDIVPSDAIYDNKDYYYPFTGKLNIAHTTSKNYLSSTSFNTTDVNYEYDIAGNIKKEITTNLQPPIQIEKVNLYSNEYVSSGNQIFTDMQNQGLFFLVGSETWKYFNGVKKLIGANATSYANLAQYGKIHSQNQYSLIGKNPLLGSNYSSGSFDFSSANSGLQVANYKKVAERILYDKKGNLLESVIETIPNTTIWDINLRLPTAIINNAHYNECAYTSFESLLYFENGTLQGDENKGNWSFSLGGITQNIAMTGKRGYQLSSSYQVNSVTTLITGKKYTVSFWYQSNSGNSAISVVNGTGNNITLVNTREITNNSSTWTLYEGTFTAQSPTISISGNCYIDELRLYPTEATIETSTYEPLNGILAQSDNRNNIIYYEYDEFGKNTIKRDINKNIISKTKYAIKTND